MPIDKIVSRYTKSMANLAAGVELADRVYLFDNSIEDRVARLCARTEGGSLRKIYADLPAWVADAVADVPRHADYADLRSA